MNNREKLLETIEHDPFGLLKVNETKDNLLHEDQKLITMFEEVVDFIDEKGREPESNTNDILEFKFYSRLKALRSDPKKIKKLKKYDFKGLFDKEDIKEITIEDIIADDSFGLISDDCDSDIFTLKHVKAAERINPDYLARRKVCSEFHLYREMFNTLHEELASKKRRLVKYSSADLDSGKFFALGGILVYLESIDGNINKHGYSSGERHRFDGRTRCIFDNGTQSDMLFRSLDKALQIDGYAISNIANNEQLTESVSEEDVLNGYIYVLKSNNPKVANIQDFYKIGFTTGSVAQRIINSRKEPTYLFSDVEVVSTFRCFNIHAHDLEQKIHDFFSSVRLDIELVDNNNDSYRPREWFNVKYSIIEEAIELIISDRIGQYEYDPRISQVIKRIN